MSDHDLQASKRRWATRAEVAQYLGVHPNTVKRWATEGRITTYSVGPRLVRYDLAEIDQMLTPSTAEETN